MFSEFVKVAKDGKAGKITKASEVSGKEVTINSDKKVEKTAKNAESNTDYSKMTVAELKEMAKEKNIEGYTSMKKAELLNALK